MKNAVNWKTLFPNTHILHIFCCTEKNHEKVDNKKKAAKVRVIVYDVRCKEP